MLAEQRVPQIKQLRILLAILGFLTFPATEEVHAQSLKAGITVSSLSAARVLIDAEGPLTDTWSFRNIYGGVTGLGERVENFQVAAAPGESVSVRNLAPGEFRSSTRVSRFSYEIRIDERSRLAELSHVSWMNQERGFLMLADLLPQIGREAFNSSSATIEFKLPAGWTVASVLRRNKNQQYTVSDTDDAVFYIGRALREKTARVDSMELVLVTSGDWAFADGDALELAGKVAREYSRLTKYRLPGRSVVMLAPFAEVVGPERWTAETRGSSVVLLMGRNAGARALLARLGVVLTHELFHLWVPNALALEGDYDWFFEGFTLYQALLTALRLDLIRFEDYLDTIARVYDSYRSLPDRDKLSLIEASERRWTASPSFVYDKGMLVAFTYDLKLRQVSRDGTPVAEIYPQLFQAAAGRGNANEIIMSILSLRPGMKQFAERYVQNPSEIELQATLAPFGLRAETTGFRTRIVIDKPNNEQRSLLRSLGYQR